MPSQAVMARMVESTAILFVPESLVANVYQVRYILRRRGAEGELFFFNSSGRLCFCGFFFFCCNVIINQLKGTAHSVFSTLLIKNTTGSCRRDFPVAQALSTCMSCNMRVPGVDGGGKGGPCPSFGLNRLVLSIFLWS